MDEVASPICCEFAPAKVNLTLHVGPPRADGYHPLDSLVVFSDWGDEITVEDGEGLTLRLDGDQSAALENEPQNLVLKAAYALRAAAGRPELGARLTLVKHLPVASGIGGGSADAAAALRALNRFWDLSFSNNQLAEIGAVIGADVPACVHARALRMRGIGETITPLLAWPELHAVMVNPRVGVSTALVFKAFDETAPPALDATPCVNAGDFAAAVTCLEAGRNDLEAPAIRAEPLIAQVLSALRQSPSCAFARMSGSGATCFGLFRTAEEASTGADHLRKRHSGWIVRQVTFGAAV